MRLEILTSPKDVAKYAALAIENVAQSFPEGPIALPTGKTPLPLYLELIQRAHAEPELFRLMHWFALDDFLSQTIALESTFGYFLKSRFVDPAKLPADRLHTLNPLAQDPQEDGRRYESLIHSMGGLKLAVLGLGNNGHIAFNEPGTLVDSRTGPRSLTEKSRKANAYLFHDSLEQTPNGAITMGIGTILEASQILVLATGESKQDVLALLQNAEAFDPAFPASALALHPNVTIVADVAAANLLG